MRLGFILIFCAGVVIIVLGVLVLKEQVECRKAGGHMEYSDYVVAGNYIGPTKGECVK